MSYNIFKSFSVKKGVGKMVDAESNVRGSNGSYVFKEHVRPFYPESPIALYAYDSPEWRCGNEVYPAHKAGETFFNEEGNTIPNDWYGLTDEEILAKWMLESAFCGDKYYQDKYKQLLMLCHDYTTEKQAAHDTAWKAENGLDPNLELDYRFLFEAAKNPEFTPHRGHFYYIENKEELAELVQYLRTNKDRYKRFKVCISFNGGYTVKTAKEDGSWKASWGNFTVNLSKQGIQCVVDSIARNGYGIAKVEYC